MRYKFCSIRVNVTKYNVTIATKGASNPPTSLPRGYTTAWSSKLLHYH